MCSPQCVLEKIADKIAEIVIQSVGHQLGFVFHYKKNMKNLQVETDELQELITTTEGEINAARTRGEVIVQNVSDWLNGAKNMRQGVQTFIEENAVKENILCFKFSCPSYCSRYWLSKEAEEKMGDVKSTIAKKAKLGMISHPAPIPVDVIFPSSEEYRSFDSRKKVVQKIMEALKDSKINVIEVYGPGGVGKTTTVEKVGKQMKEDGLFDEVVMAVVSKEANVAKIQEALAEQLDLKLEKNTEKVRAGEIWNRFNNGKKNLVILDDLWEEMDLKQIGVPITDGNKGCKVMLTSRNKCGMKNRQVDKDFQIEVLSDEEAWNLFKEKVGEQVECQGQLHEIASEVCKECGGLPVAILAVGAALKNKSMAVWKATRNKLRRSMLEDIDKKLVSSLRLSYDYLESKDAKSCFLLCCLYPEDAQIPIQELVRHCVVRRLLGQNLDTLEEARDIVCSAVNTLKTSSLLLEGKDDDFVKMHDVIRDIAILIAEEEKAYLVKHGVKEWPETGTCEKYSAISLRSEAIPELPNEMVCPELHTLMLESPSLKIPDKFFNGTKKLVILELNRVVMLPLPSSLGELMELRMLYLNKCQLGDITMLKYLKNKLEVLSLRGSDIKALPHEVGELTRLRLLDLRDCYQLEVIPRGVISKLVWLEELYFPNYFKIWEDATGNEERSKVSLDELISLTRLSTLEYIRVRYIPRLPVDLLLRNLIRFRILLGTGRYATLDENDECSRQGVMWIEGMRSDDDLSIWERLLGKPKWFNNLTQLVIEYCGSLKYLFTPSSARELQQLQRLRIRRSGILESVIRNEGETDEEIIENAINFSQLKILELRDLPCLISFYPRIKKGSPSLLPAQGLFNDKVAFPTLETLEIRSLGKITGIWDMQIFSIPENASNSSFSNLRAMGVDDCSNLETVVKGFSNMEVRGTKEIQESQVASYIVQFPQLRTLGLYKLGMLSSFSDASLITQTRPLFNGQVAFPTLETLEIQSLGKITGIWDMQIFSIPENASNSSFSNLRAMELRDCSNLENVVKGFANMEVRGTKEIQESQVASYILQFPQLRFLELYKLEMLSSFSDASLITQTRPLFDGQVAFPTLETLQIRSLGKITGIWDMQIFSIPENASNSSFSNLRAMDVDDCSNLENVVKGFSNMEVRGTEEIQESQVANYVLQFTQLRSLGLCDLEKLSSFSDASLTTQTQPLFNGQVSFTADSSSTESRIKDTSIITETQPLFNHKSTLPALEVLEIESLPMITAIWGMQTFSQSKINDISLITETRSLFNLQGCETLKNVVPSHMLSVIPNIKSLSIGSCLKIEVIIVLEKREEEVEEATNKDIIEFPKLCRLTLLQLEQLKGVCAYKSRDQLYFDVQVVFPELGYYRLHLDAHSKKIFKEAISGNKEMMDRFASRYPEMVRDDSEEEDVSEDEDEETHEKEKGGAVIRTPIPDKDDSQDEFKDEDEETPKKTGPSQKNLTKVAIKSLGPDEDDLEDEDNSWDEDEETSKKADPSERKPMEFATKTPILGEDDKKDEDEETPKKAKVGSTRKG